MNAPIQFARAAALAAYQGVDSAGASPEAGTSSASLAASGAGAGAADFSSLMSQALESAITTGRQADAQSMQAIAGHGDLTQVVAAVSRAQLALQTTVAVRDRVLQAYQDIIKMPI